MTKHSKRRIESIVGFSFMFLGVFFLFMPMVALVSDHRMTDVGTVVSTMLGYVFIVIGLIVLFTGRKDNDNKLYYRDIDRFVDDAHRLLPKHEQRLNGEICPCGKSPFVAGHTVVLILCRYCFDEN